MKLPDYYEFILNHTLQESIGILSSRWPFCRIGQLSRECFKYLFRQSYRHASSGRVYDQGQLHLRRYTFFPGTMGWPFRCSACTARFHQGKRSFGAEDMAIPVIPCHRWLAFAKNTAESYLSGVLFDPFRFLSGNAW